MLTLIKIRQSLLSVNWDRNISNKNPNNQVNFITNCIIKSFTNICRYINMPWITSENKQKLKEKTEIYNLYFVLCVCVCVCEVR